jgi:transcriptional regulator with XRE-family HTH domain
LTKLETRRILMFVGRRLGDFLRQQRHKTGKGIKQIAPELELSYSYLSKLENGLIEPSEETIKKLAKVYGVSAELIGTLAGRLPDDVVAILEGQPEEAIRLLRERFGK